MRSVANTDLIIILSLTDRYCKSDITAHWEETRWENREKGLVQKECCLLKEAITRHWTVDGHIGGGRDCPFALSAMGQLL